MVAASMAMAGWPLPFRQAAGRTLQDTTLFMRRQTVPPEVSFKRIRSYKISTSQTLGKPSRTGKDLSTFYEYLFFAKRKHYLVISCATLYSTPIATTSVSTCARWTFLEQSGLQLCCNAIRSEYRWQCALARRRIL
eukprot:s2542_g4.t1